MSMDTIAYFLPWKLNYSLNNAGLQKHNAKTNLTQPSKTNKMHVRVLSHCAVQTFIIIIYSDSLFKFNLVQLIFMPPPKYQSALTYTKSRLSMLQRVAWLTSFTFTASHIAEISTTTVKRNKKQNKQKLVERSRLSLIMQNSVVGA